MLNTPIFVDLQGFTFRNTFAVKEAAVLRDGDTLSHYIFREPVPWSTLTKSERSQVCWLRAHHHGFRWEDGHVPYSQAEHLIRQAIVVAAADSTPANPPPPPLIYVKGLEKKKWLSEILNNEFTIETIDADYKDIARLRDLSVVGTLRCAYHTENCAMRNVCKLYAWWRRDKCVSRQKSAVQIIIIK